MLDFSRYRGILVVGISVLAAIAILEGMLFVVAGRSPPWLSTERHPYEWEDLESVGSKLAGVAVQQQAKEGGLGCFGVILGRSTSREGLDPNVLEANFVPDFRWLSLYGSGSSLTYLEDLDELTALAQLKPAVVIFAINLHMLVGLPTKTERIPVNPKEIVYDLRARNWSKAARDAEAILESKSWILTYRSFLNNHYRRMIYRTRIQFFAYFGLGIQSLFLPDPDPWQVKLRGYPLHRSPDSIRAFWPVAARFGWFDPQRYATPSPQADSLVQQIANWQARG
jgi:hypothetical protein